MTNQILTVAGATGGKRVNVVPAVKPAYELLNRAAIGGSYWARVAVGGIKALASGRMGKDNIYTRQETIMTRNVEEFCVFLPGCTASFERRSNDQYYLVNLVIDNTFAEIQGDQEATGLHKAEKLEGAWDTTKYPNNRSDVADSEIRITAVSDSTYSSAKEAVKDIGGSISKAPDVPAGKNFKIMDVHFTKDKGKLGGLMNFSHARAPLTNDAIKGSSMLLAKSMIASKDKSITWVSEKGGSAVLTQALRMVGDANVKLEKHNMFLFDPSTSTKEAFDAAYRAGLEPDRNAVSTSMFNYMGNRNQISTAINRVRNEKGYTALNGVTDIAKLGTKVQGLVGLGAGAVGLAGLTVAAPSIPMMTAIAGALGVTGTAVGALKIGDKLAENIAPHFYNRHIGKIK